MLSPLALPDKRLAPMSADQHNEIERLIRSSMDSKAKNPTPRLTRMGRTVVRREITTLARIAGVRRLKSHATTFRRSLAWFEQHYDSLPAPKQRAGRLTIEHLWRWLHGYTRSTDTVRLNLRPERETEIREARLVPPTEDLDSGAGNNWSEKTRCLYDLFMASALGDRALKAVDSKILDFSRWKQSRPRGR